MSVLFLSLIISRLAFPFDNGILEAFNWMPAQHVLEGKNPYAFALTPPYSMTPYGAVFYVLIAFGQKLFGFQLWWGRLLTVLAFAFCLWAVAKITKKITGEKEAVRIALLAGLAMFPAQFWIGAVRPDLIAFAFAAGAAWLIFTRVEEGEKTSAAVIAGIVLFSCAAFFTKQTFFLTAGIAFLRFLQLGKWRAAFLTASAFAILAAAGIFLLNYTSGGGYVWQHWTHAQRLTFSWSQVIFEFLRILKTPVFSLALVFLLVFIYRGRKAGFVLLFGIARLGFRFEPVVIPQNRRVTSRFHFFLENLAQFRRPAVLVFAEIVEMETTAAPDDHLGGDADANVVRRRRRNRLFRAV
ncbi:MAG: glycosyltransferase family 39 protein [Acidobacteriota bacterium]|nr:glycosyltransferase family 39 protein [Acidobacteriota bacterium]